MVQELSSGLPCFVPANWMRLNVPVLVAHGVVAPVLKKLNAALLEPSKFNPFAPVTINLS